MTDQPRQPETHIPVQPTPASTPATSTPPPVLPADSWPTRLRSTCRLARLLHRSGCYTRRLPTQVIDSLVLLFLGILLFAGTLYSPIQRQGKSTFISWFPDIPLASRLQCFQQPAPADQTPAIENPAERAHLKMPALPDQTAPAPPSAAAPTVPPDSPGLILLRHRIAAGTEITWTYLPPVRWPLPLVLFALYHAVLIAVCGQTLGKRMMGLRVVGKGGGRVGYLRALVRAVLCPVFAAWWVGVLGILIDRHHRGWHDLVAKTRVD